MHAIAPDVTASNTSPQCQQPIPPLSLCDPPVKMSPHAWIVVAGNRIWRNYENQRYQNMGVSESSAADVSQVFCSQISKADCRNKNGDSSRFLRLLKIIF